MFLETNIMNEVSKKSHGNQHQGAIQEYCQILNRATDQFYSKNHSCKSDIKITNGRQTLHQPSATKSIRNEI